MTWSIPIGSVAGTTIRIHITFLMLLAWIGVAHYAQGGAAAAAQGLALIILLFLCVLLHEFGHVFMARRYGVRTPDITLLPIGGVARLERIPEEPTQELLIALAGPAVNLVIGVALYLAVYASMGGLILPEAANVENAHAGLLTRLASVNLFLVVFNLIPAFPMDGGRALRALLAYRLGYGRATQIAAATGQGVAFLLGLAGLFSNPLLLFIALFVYLGASSEAYAVQMRQASRAMIVADAMITKYESLSPLSRVEDAVQCLIRTTQHEFPVVDGARRLRGVLTRDAMIRALREGGPDVPVIDVMHRDVPLVREIDSLDQAMRLLQSGAPPAVGVTNADHQLIGLITPENIGEMMMVQAAQSGRQRNSATPQPPVNPWI